MPTDLPVRSRVQTRSDGWAKYGQALLIFYGSAGLALLLLIAVEQRSGMFDGLTVRESIVKAVGGQSVDDGADPNWASSPPF
jgi:hypothetical protein